MVAAVTMFAFSSEDVAKRFISAEQLMTACDQVWSVDGRAEIKTERSQPPAGSRVYCKVDHLVGLFDQIRQARNRVILVSSESDRPITKEFFQRCPPQVAHWFSTNIQTKHERLSVLPLGLANSYCGITLKAPLIAAHLRPLAERSHWLYVNFRTGSNPAVREPITYLAVGPVFGTTTKDTGYSAVGLGLVSTAARLAGAIPVVAIGGITLETASSVLEAGATSVAVVGDLLMHGHPQGRVAAYLQRLEQHRV